LENGDCDMARHLPDCHCCLLAIAAVYKGFSFALENPLPYTRHCADNGVHNVAFLDKNITGLACSRQIIYGF
jgi:hypothetical protein